MMFSFCSPSFDWRFFFFLFNLSPLCGWLNILLYLYMWTKSGYIQVMITGKRSMCNTCGKVSVCVNLALTKLWYVLHFLIVIMIMTDLMRTMDNEWVEFVSFEYCSRKKGTFYLHGWVVYCSQSSDMFAFVSQHGFSNFCQDGSFLCELLWDVHTAVSNKNESVQWKGMMLCRIVAYPLRTQLIYSKETVSEKGDDRHFWNNMQIGSKVRKDMSFCKLLFCLRMRWCHW